MINDYEWILVSHLLSHVIPTFSCRQDVYITPRHKLHLVWFGPGIGTVRSAMEQIPTLDNPKAQLETCEFRTKPFGSPCFGLLMAVIVSTGSFNTEAPDTQLSFMADKMPTVCVQCFAPQKYTVKRETTRNCHDLSVTTWYKNAM